MPQTDAPAASQAEGRPRRFARLLEAALALFFPGDENPAASASSENSALSGHEILSKTPEESPSSSSTPTGEKHHPPRDRKSPQSASLAPEVASALSAMATAAPPTISPPETSVSSSHPTTLSEKTTAPADRIGTVLIPRAETNANGSAQTALPSSIEPDESTLSERAPGETHPATPDVRSAAFHGSQSMEAEATPETPVPSDGARLTQATSAQTRHEVAPRPLNQAEMQRPPAMTPESASAPAQAKHTPAPVVPELAAHVAQQSGAAPDSDRAPTYQDRFVENGSSTSHRGVDLETAFGIRPVHLQASPDTTNQETMETALPESRSVSSMPAETAPQGKPASESRPLLSLTAEASESVNVSTPTQTPTEAEAAPATAVRQKNHATQKQALPASSHDGPPATAGTPAQQTADNPTPQSSGLHSPAVSSEVSHAHFSEEATDRAETATEPDRSPAKPSAPESDASTREADPKFRQNPESDPTRKVRRTPEQIAHSPTTSRATDRAETTTEPEHSPAKPSAPESDASTREADPKFTQAFETDPSPDVQLAAEEIDRPLNASMPTPSPQTTALPRVIRTAAWFQMAMAFAERVRQHVDGQMLEVELADGEGTLRVETRRHPDHVAVSVQLSDPQLRALVAAHADRIQEALQAQYQTAVQFSLSGGGEQGARQQQAFAQAPTHGTPLASGSDTSGSTPVESSRARVLHPGSRHEWIG